MGFDYVIYLDVLIMLLGTNFICDYLLLWATAATTLTKTTWQRLLMGASLGTVHFLLLYLANLRIIPYYGILRALPTVFCLTLVMIWVAFYPTTSRRMVVLFGHFTTIGIGAGGIGLAAAYLLGTPQHPNAFLGLLAATAGILIIAELGWGVVQKKMLSRVYQLPVTIHFGPNQIKITGLIDTGNHLTDPLTGAPVVILEEAQVTKLLPNELANSISHLAKGEQAAIEKLLSSSWSNRFRIIPYSSLENAAGMLIGFRPDLVTVEIQGMGLPIQDTVVALCNHELDPLGEYKALVPPSIVQNTLGHLQASANLAP
ncbi:MAG: sigma-E processing peptidase SpoIIGA [Firmicutes bacterium]|nr:sigma-E processing peptidase SpoIIGA [Bacillota bacterium]